MSFSGFFKALLPFSWSNVGSDVDALVKQIGDKAKADIANITAAAAKAQAKVTNDALVASIKTKLASDVASLQSAITALTAQAQKDIASATVPTPPAVGAPTGATGASGPSVITGPA